MSRSSFTIPHAVSLERIQLWDENVVLPQSGFYRAAENYRIFCLNGGAEGDRTPDLRNAIATLSQLSYGPVPLSL